jgi:predicted small secreted protein
MKNTFKVKTIYKIAGVIAIVAIIGFSMAACNDGSGGGNKILGLPYSLKFEHKDNFGGGELISYILDCSYDEAFEILTQKLGRVEHQVDALGIGDNDFTDYIHANPDWVAFQDRVDGGQYFLVHKYRPNEPSDLTTDGRSWNKPFERKGTLRITGIPAKHEGQIADFTIHDSLVYWVWVVNTINQWFNWSDPWGKGGYSVIRNGSVDIPLWWFPQRYDRSGTYNHGERYSIYLDIVDSIPWTTSVRYRFPTVTFNNGSAELDFNIGTYDSTEHPK